MLRTPSTRTSKLVHTCTQKLTLSREMENHEKFKILLSSFNVTQSTRFLDDILDQDNGQIFTEAAAAVVSAYMRYSETWY
jgi:hypothetical protein